MRKHDQLMQDSHIYRQERADNFFNELRARKPKEKYLELRRQIRLMFSGKMTREEEYALRKFVGA